MYRVSPEIPRIQHLLSIASALCYRAQPQNRRSIGEIAKLKDPMSILRNLGALPFLNSAERIQDVLTDFASWYGGREIVGFGVDAVVTRSDDGVLKFATNPLEGNARKATDTLRRRFEIASEYLGPLLVPTEFDVGVVDGETEERVVMMAQPFLLGASALTAIGALTHPQTEELRAKALQLVDETGIIVDLRPDSGNVLRDPSRDELLIVDAVMSHLDDHGQPRILNPRFRVDVLTDQGHISGLGQVPISAN